MTFRLPALRSGTSLLALACLPAALGCGVMAPSQTDHYKVARRSAHDLQLTNPTICATPVPRLPWEPRRAAPALDVAMASSGRAACALPGAARRAARGVRFEFMDGVLLGLGFGLATLRPERDGSVRRAEVRAPRR